MGAARLFAGATGSGLSSTPLDSIRIMENIAAGRIGKAVLAGWFRRHLKT